MLHAMLANRGEIIREPFMWDSAYQPRRIFTLLAVAASTFAIRSHAVVVTPRALPCCLSATSLRIDLPTVFR